MNIIICGAGKVGFSISKQLSAQGHSVTVIDQSSEDIKKINDTQDVKGIVIESSSGEYPIDKSPWLPLRYTRIDGEDYGRGFVEEYIGDLKSLESLTKAIVEGSAAAAKVLFMVNPNGTTRARTLAEAPNGAIVQGSDGDVSVLQLNKFNDFRVVFSN